MPDKNFGLLENLQEFTAYILGGSQVPYIPYQEDGNWEPYLPKYEAQADEFESYGCTEWGLQNQIEIMYKRLFGTEPNYDEWFNYPLVPINVGGQDPQVTYESARKTGFIPAGTVDTPRTIQEARDKSRITSSMLAKGQNWLQAHDFKHEWLWNSRPSNAVEVMHRALETSPLGVSVTAWMQDDSGKYVDNGMRNNHWCVCYKIDDEGIHIFDTYDHSKKVLHIDHKIARVKRIWLNKKTYSASKRHKNVLVEILERLMNKKTLLQHCQDSIGIDITPDDMIPDNVSCAITVSTLLRRIDVTFPLVAGTWTLWDILEHRKDYERVTVPSAETIIISPTGTGNGSMPGHVGIFMEDGIIASNDSNTGKFLKNYTLDTWYKRYVEKGGFKIQMYKKK